ncbi:uncharacterized protein KY384_009059 [Bacidia gigantensis]|uniref:uncharacterized protein n=1 Tax=Bacidia gigantensis TaxID=2732470 RepID=UPI001D043AF1|nr:uncharacterized protein KY384_009059 [Bacidia gigantensis]KAG8525415.1 hypothetical protein KY384_009059 [Bacidia gigantensis]
MVSILGKRARAQDLNHGETVQCVQTATLPPNVFPDTPSSVTARVKRRACVQEFNDENVNPIDVYNHSRSAVKSSRTFEKILCVEEDTENHAQLPTPKTPRHRDALSKRVPITPRHRVGINGKLSTPRTPRTPQTPRTPLNALTVYHSARELFTKGADPGSLIGREREKEELQSFLESKKTSSSNRSIYLSGPPGTGKSALVGEICQSLQITDSIKVAYINCMSIKSANDMYSKLADEFLDGDVFGPNNVTAELQSVFLSKGGSCSSISLCLCLDEMDHLLTMDLEIVYTLFEWSLHKSSRLIIIGIANALDLTDRFLPRLKARNLKPQLLPFLPYTASQIESIITSKLRSLLGGSEDKSDFIPFVHPQAVQLCSKKVASQNGDLRKAFDIIRRTIDLIENETRAKPQVDRTPCSPHSPSKSPLSENPNLASTSPSKTRANSALPSTLTPLTAPRATIAHVSRVAAATLGNGTSQRLQTLNLQQKAALCALISHQKLSRNKYSSIFSTPTQLASAGPTPRKLHETYSGLCKRDNALHPLTLAEFTDVISGLETLGLVGEDIRRASTKGLTPQKITRHDERRLTSFVDEKEVQCCLEGVQGSILRGLVHGDG